MTEDEQRRFGINKNLLKTKVPTHYGKGEHKVKLAYITEPEAKILKEYVSIFVDFFGFFFFNFFIHSLLISKRTFF